MIEIHKFTAAFYTIILLFTFISLISWISFYLISGPVIASPPPFEHQKALIEGKWWNWDTTMVDQSNGFSVNVSAQNRKKKLCNCNALYTTSRAYLSPVFAIKKLRNMSNFLNADFSPSLETILLSNLGHDRRDIKKSFLSVR